MVAPTSATKNSALNYNLKRRNTMTPEKLIELADHAYGRSETEYVRLIH